MKRNLLFAVLAITGLLCGISSCQKAPELTLTSSSNIEFSADGSSGSITFTANRDWTARANDSWVSVSPSSGAASDGAVTVTVRCNANTTYEDRSTTVTINMGDLSQTVTVKQPANKGIVLPKQVFELQSDTRSIDVEVQANVQYSVSSSVDWIKQTGTKALTSKTLTFSIQENKTYDSREGKITIKPNEGNVQEQVITVRQAQKDALIVEKTSYDMPYGGGEIEIKVEANVAFNVTPNVDWLHYIQTKALSSSTVCIKVDENSTFSNREGKIEIAQQNGSLKHSITVKQAGRIAVTSVTLDKTSVKLKEGESVTLVATVKPDNATDKTVTWTSSEAAVASVDASGKVTAIKEGSATITAKAGEKSATCSVIVKNDVPVNSVELNRTTLSLIAGETASLVATVKPDEATDKTVTWSSSDSQIASVDNQGKITAVAKGHASITAKAGDKTASCSVTVDNAIVLNGNLSNSCFIITQKGEYKILCSNAVGSGANSAFVLWNENGKDDIINLALQGNYIYFEMPSFQKGNAVVSLAKDGVVVKSWHLWRTDEPQYIDGIMDRNLGATSAAPNNEDAYGLMYSYGSPFPFPGAKYKDWMLTSEPSVPSGWYVAPGYGFYAESKMPTEATPMLYCTSSEKYGNSTFWRNTSMYSPCPEGTSKLSHASLQNLIGYEPSFNGLNGILLSNGLFIPAAGYIRVADREGVSNAGIEGGYWGVGIYNNAAVDARACWFYEGFSKASSYYRGNTLHSIRTIRAR